MFANCGLELEPVPIKCCDHVCVPAPLLLVKTGRYSTFLFNPTSKTLRQLVKATESTS